MRGVFERSTFRGFLGGGGNSAPFEPSVPLMQRAAAYWKVGSYDGGVLTDLTGNGHHAVLGSTSGSDDNDPVVLPFDGEKYLYLPGINLNYASATVNPSPMSLSAGEMRFTIQPDALTPSAGIISTGNYPRVTLQGTSNLELSFLNIDSEYAGTIVRPHGLTPGDLGTFRVTWEYDGTTITSRVFSGPSIAGPWTLIGVPDVRTPAKPLASPYPSFRIGIRDSTTSFVGRIYRGQWWNGIEGEGGVLVGDFNPADSSEPHISFASFATGETWTINRSASGCKAVVVDRPLLLMGTDDYLEIPSDASWNISDTDNFTAVTVFRGYNSGVTNKSIMVRRAAYSGGSQQGWRIGHTSGNGVSVFVRGNSSGDTTNLSSGAYNNGMTTGVAMIAEPDGLSAWTSDGGFNKVSPRTSGSASNNLAIRIGADGAPSPNYMDMEFIGAAIFREPLSEAQLSRVVSQLLIF